MIGTVIILGLASSILTETISEFTTTENIVTDEAFTEGNIAPQTITSVASSEGEKPDNITNDLTEPKQPEDEGYRVVSEYQYQRYFPYVVALYDSEGKYSCMGSVLTPRLILTAKSCVSSPNPAASIRAYSRNNAHGGETHFINRSIFYGDDDGSHQIALISLNSSIANAFAVNLLSPNVRVYENEWLLALGWGKLSNGSHHRNLIMAYIRLSPVGQCREEYPGVDFICTQSQEDHICKGNAGGPLLYHGLLVGVVLPNRHTRCRSGEPLPNVNVKKYWSWIQSYVKDSDYS